MSTDETSSVAAAAQSGPPPIHMIKFETPPTYRGLQFFIAVYEGLGSLVLFLDAVLFLSWLGQLNALTVGIMALVLVGGATMIATAEAIRLLIRMQHDAMRTREYLHYVAWWALTQKR